MHLQAPAVHPPMESEPVFQFHAETFQGIRSGGRGNHRFEHAGMNQITCEPACDIRHRPFCGHGNCLWANLREFFHDCRVHCIRPESAGFSLCAKIACHATEYDFYGETGVANLDKGFEKPCAVRQQPKGSAGATVVPGEHWFVTIGNTSHLLKEERNVCQMVIGVRQSPLLFYADKSDSAARPVNGLGHIVGIKRISACV